MTTSSHHCRNLRVHQIEDDECHGCVSGEQPPQLVLMWTEDSRRYLYFKASRWRTGSNRKKSRRQREGQQNETKLEKWVKKTKKTNESKNKQHIIFDKHAEENFRMKPFSPKIALAHKQQEREQEDRPTKTLKKTKDLLILPCTANGHQQDYSVAFYGCGPSLSFNRHIQTINLLPTVMTP